MPIKNQFTIKDLEVLSGIKAHTIRIWEQRYELLAPARTDTNIRSYSNDDLKLLLNVSFLYNNGIKISKIADMTREEINNAVNDIFEKSHDFVSHINDLTIAMIEMDELKFEKVISRSAIQFGFSKMMEEVIYPFLEKVGIMWVTSNIHPAQEHFITNLIRQKIIVAIDGIVVHAEKAKGKFLLFLPDFEIHEITLLYANYLLRSRQRRTLYLGVSVPFDDIESLYHAYQPDHLFTILTTYREEEELEDFLQKLSKTFAGTEIFISGAQIMDYSKKLPSNITIFRDLTSFKNHLEQ